MKEKCNDYRCFSLEEINIKENKSFLYEFPFILLKQKQNNKSIDVRLCMERG